MPNIQLPSTPSTPTAPSTLYYDLNVLHLLILAASLSGALTGYALKKIKNKISAHWDSKMTTIVISVILGCIGGNIYIIYANITDVLPGYASNYLESFIFVPTIHFIGNVILIYVIIPGPPKWTAPSTKFYSDLDCRNVAMSNTLPTAPVANCPVGGISGKEYMATVNNVDNAFKAGEAKAKWTPAIIQRSLSSRNIGDSNSDDLMAKFWESGEETLI